MNARPLGNKVLIRPDEARKKTEGGILLPDISAEKPHRGTVVSVGPGKLDDNGNRIAPSVKKGDCVLFEKWSGQEVKELDDCLIISEDNILAVIEKGE